MIPMFNPNFYKDIYDQKFTYEPCAIDYFNRFKMLDSHSPLNIKIKAAFEDAISELEWGIRYCISVVIYPLLDYEARNKCKYINQLSQKAVYAFSEFVL